MTKALLGAGALALMSGMASAQELACLITKNNTNPFFVKMKEGAEAAAKTAGLDFQAYAGEKDGDAAPQITAIENCVAAGAKGILITPSNDSVGPALKDARAAGILVIALDTPLADTEAQDITFATDNFEAGLLIGKWAAATMGAEAANAKIAMLDINKDNISVDVQRDTGFLVGFGIEVPDLTVLGSETDPRVIGHESSDANPEGGLRAMETLLAKDPDINVVYTINEPAAEGAYQALKNAGKEGQAIIVSVDGGCPGVASVKSGVIGATSQQYPLKMASLGIEAIAAYAKDGTKPTVTEGLSFFNTGVNLVTDKPVDGVPSIDSTKGTELCWG
ncbi:substrate-binding domain-containing protein [Tabrizicola sp.]|jgi:fructose transport system substrate-binding protein|uniref:substrate-binding domain-containing protein n=1 Tax=Tabrizicola sp. TaxID=2005166 RepID=UPI000BDC1DA3|nr:substrate-binding domain-containing protein [Tabrizicola sp.]MBY0351926.1 substrate-binding domain-containing protein [Tabrizicola sp.]OYX18814.1 MAG: sugar ABC transporter [Rhodobacterales bacterium 32-66-9]